MSLKFRDNKWILTRGDTAWFNVTVTDAVSGQEYILVNGDVLLFTLRKYRKEKDATNYIFQKTFEDNQVKIEPSDTSDLNYGDYHFDVELRFANGDIQTVVDDTILSLGSEIS